MRRTRASRHRRRLLLLAAAVGPTGNCSPTAGRPSTPKPDGPAAADYASQAAPRLVLSVREGGGLSQPSPEKGAKGKGGGGGEKREPRGEGLCALPEEGEGLSQGGGRGRGPSSARGEGEIRRGGGGKQLPASARSPSQGVAGSHAVNSPRVGTNPKEVHSPSPSMRSRG